MDNKNNSDVRDVVLDERGPAAGTTGQEANQQLETSRVQGKLRWTYGRVAAHDADDGLVVAKQCDGVLVRTLTRVARLGVDRDLVRHDTCP